jgi:adenylylsulfate kinase-like enzyme
LKLLDFSEAARKAHNLHVGKMASALEKKGKVVIVSLISPYVDVRNEIRDLCTTFIEVYVQTPLELCIRRDPKGLYKKAMAGQIQNFTGITAPYYPPANPEITVYTDCMSVADCSERILRFYLAKE